MDPETVSAKERLLSFINQIAAEQKFKTFEVKINPVSTGGGNYTSNLFKIKILSTTVEMSSTCLLELVL